MSQCLNQLVLDWGSCTRCPLGERATTHVLWEFLEPPDGVEFATIPANPRVPLLMFGEGPGEAENGLGRPFVGPVGRLLRRAIADSGLGRFRICLSNLVACRPQNKVNGTNRAPIHEEIVRCQPRLGSLILLTRPVVIAPLGRIPQQYVQQTIRWAGNCDASQKEWRPTVYEAYHPSYVYRQGPGGTSYDFPAYHSYVSRLRVLACILEEMEHGDVLPPLDLPGDAWRRTADFSRRRR